MIGRFISADSVVQDPYNPQSLNRYSYCLNNPLIYVDPSGHVYDDYIAEVEAAQEAEESGGFWGWFTGLLDGWDAWQTQYEIEHGLYGNLFARWEYDPFVRQFTIDYARLAYDRFVRQFTIDYNKGPTREILETDDPGKALLELGKVYFEPELDKLEAWKDAHPVWGNSLMVGLGAMALHLGVLDEIPVNYDTHKDITSYFSVELSISGRIDSNFHLNDLEAWGKGIFRY